jgi:hypothetical protein
MLTAYVDRIFLMQSCLLQKLFRGSTSQYWSCYSEVIDDAPWKLETAGFDCKWPTGSVHTYILERLSGEYLKGVMQIFVLLCTANSRMRPYLQNVSGKN